VQNKNEPQNLLGDLESIKRLLYENDADGQTNAPEKIPILLDAVSNIVPVLKETIETSHNETASVAVPAHDSADAGDQQHPVTQATESRLQLEGEQLIDNLLEEYLPLMESRLREQLRLRLSFIIKEQMRKYR
jgi:hypothetical protein